MLAVEACGVRVSDVLPKQTPDHLRSRSSRSNQSLPRVAKISEAERGQERKREHCPYSEEQILRIGTQLMLLPARRD